MKPLWSKFCKSKQAQLVELMKVHVAFPKLNHYTKYKYMRIQSYLLLTPQAFDLITCPAFDSLVPFSRCTSKFWSEQNAFELQLPFESPKVPTLRFDTHNLTLSWTLLKLPNTPPRPFFLLSTTRWSTTFFCEPLVSLFWLSATVGDALVILWRVSLFSHRFFRLDDFFEVSIVEYSHKSGVWAYCY